MRNNLLKISSFKLFSLFYFMATSVLFSQQNEVKSLVNTSHLDHLYQQINVDGKEMGIIHIYSNYPDYKYTDAPGEGIACVDDIARADIFYMKYYEVSHDSSVYNKIKMLTNFLLYMQSDNGFFNNFIFGDYSKNTTYKTSVAEPNWWSWRAIWALGEANNFFLKYDKSFAAAISPQLEKAVKVTKKWLVKNESDSTQNFSGFKLPTWLPLGTAADQAAVIVKGFLSYYKATNDTLVRNEAIRLCTGIEGMQAGDASYLPHYAFLSWQNTWHMWGNNQAEALIDAGIMLNNLEYIKKAQKEIWDFYPYLIKANYMSSFTIEHVKDTVVYKDSTKFGQIAYGISPMVLASCKSYNATKDVASATVAGLLGCWLFGKNPAGKPMYNIKTGVCFDGINNENEINMNSGAESTIEALFSMLAIDQNPIAKKIVWNYYNEHIGANSK
ncbi:MAG TPA: hypothetical protein VMV32_11400 [Ignavibacteriaceae bacterium]|nr:hypothetical protein [Ignavibacteriaceae bacterium]